MSIQGRTSVVAGTWRRAGLAGLKESRDQTSTGYPSIWVEAGHGGGTTRTQSKVCSAVACL